MQKKNFFPLTEYVSVRLSKKELEALEAYCAENELTNSQYLRRLLRIHLGFANGRNMFYALQQSPKKADER